MNLFISEKKIPIIKLITVLLVGLLSVILTRVSFIYGPSFLLLSVTISCFTFVTYYTGLYSLIPAIVLFIAVFLIEDFQSALAILAFLPPALAAGFALRLSKKPVTVILCISFAYILFELIYFIFTRIITDGAFSFSTEFGFISSYIENNISTLFQTISNITGDEFGNVNAFISLAKAVAVGTYISVGVSKACIIYFVTAILFKITKSDKIIVGTSIFDIITSKVTAIIYIICLLFTFLSSVSPDNIRYYSMLAQNVLLVLTPVLIYSGIYYITTIKFKKEHASPFMLVLSIIVSLLGAYPILIFYLALSGVTYSLKYSDHKKIEDSDYDEKTQC